MKSVGTRGKNERMRVRNQCNKRKNLEESKLVWKPVKNGYQRGVWEEKEGAGSRR
jgi:hypothetical protein